ncbi:GNAT family N-acetyltransferase [Roseomonas gilardii subsp. gilardii]|uniref:GNAT family N-acetyltransferase n=1 Tax=Roseomonas gilardii TaxID=257708 RepID=UPI001FF7C19E|nr:GNAT family N-acetyltransferase [Roseomonas gilardii]UPG74272.1 GNAT family N-acetyltransferase [Roseomonas gilardii subsp. gilardii]
MSAIRRAHPGEARRIAELHAAAWRETYPGLLPEAVIAARTVERGEAVWREVLAGAAPRPVFVVQEAPGAPLLGFGACGPQRDVDLRAAGFPGEVTALYLLRAGQGLGHGGRMLRRMAQALEGMALTPFALWVLSTNRQARDFYARLGGTPVLERQAQLSGHAVPETAYGWHRPLPDTAPRA